MNWLRQDELEAARRLLARREPNRIISKDLSESRQQSIRSLVSEIRQSRGGVSNGNLNFRSINPLSHINIQDKLQNLLHYLAGDLPEFIRDQTTNVRLLLRYRPNISNRYAAEQTLHLDVIANRSQGGEAFMQFIYYIDTPKISRVLLNGTIKRENAPISERGSLLLKPRFGNNRTPRKIIPKAGRIVFFPPMGVEHEVTAPLRNFPGNVDRNMIIGFLYRPMPNNLINMNRQIRPFQNMFGRPTEATIRYTRLVRALANVNIPGTQRNNTAAANLSNILTRIAITNRFKRRRSNTNKNPRPLKRQRLSL